MELRHLRYFVAVAEELHFTRAAARLDTAQPALSRQIRHLERELGIDLFTRTNRRVELTDAGHVFLEHARRTLDEADMAKRAAHQAARGDLGRLEIGYMPLAAGELLPKLLLAHRARHPQVEVVLHELQTAAQIDALVNGHIHLGLLLHRDEEPRIHVEMLQSVPLVVAMPAGHRFARRRSIQLRELASERWIAGINHMGILYATCAKAGFEPLIAQHISGPEARLSLVAAGLGLALTFESAPRPPGRRIIYRPIDRPKAAIELAAAWPKNRPSPLLEGFLATTRSVVAPPVTRAAAV